MEIISIVASKGGVGKTTVSNVIAGMLNASGKSVALLDTDCNQYSSETTSFSDLLSYPVITVPSAAKFNELIKTSEYDFIVIDTAPHAHDSDLFIHILSHSDVVIGVTRPLPNDALAFEKIMLPVLGKITKPKKVVLINQRNHIQSAIQQAAEELIHEKIGSEISILNTVLHSRASYAAIGYFEVDGKADRKRIEETNRLQEELQKKGII